MKKLLAVFAHPDDESFGPSGTLAKYAKCGVDIHLLCATKGEAGQNHDSKNQKEKIAKIRVKELRKAAKILGIGKVEFLGFKDGELKQNNYHILAKKISIKIKEFKPQVVLTYENRGISGHLDHIAVSLTTTYAWLRTKESKKLYYYCLPKYLMKSRLQDYFIYFPEGYDMKEITTKINIKKYWTFKKRVILAHKSQLEDTKQVLQMFSNRPKMEYFILKYKKIKNIQLPEKDLFAGINN